MAPYTIVKDFRLRNNHAIFFREKPPTREVMSMRTSYDGRKICLRCRQRKSIEFFPTKHHRFCVECALPPVAKPADANQRFQDKTDVLTSWVENANIANARESTPGAALTMTRAGKNKYNRERARMERALAREADPRPEKPPTLVHPNRVKCCRTCKQFKRVSEFAHPSFRICLACDGPRLFLAVPTSEPKPTDP